MLLKIIEKVLLNRNAIVLFYCFVVYTVTVHIGPPLLQLLYWLPSGRA